MVQIIKLVCICASSVWAHSHGHISWSIFTKISTDVTTPKSINEFVGFNIAPRTILSPILPRKCRKVLKVHPNINNLVSALTMLVEQHEGHPACKNWVVGCWRGYLSGARCKFAYGLADAIAIHCLWLQEIQNGIAFTFLVPAHPRLPKSADSRQNPEFEL